MRKFSFSFLIVCLLAIVLVSGCKKKGEDTGALLQEYLRFDYVLGNVNIKPKGSKWQKLQIGLVLDTACQVKTSSDSSAVVRFRSGDMLRIQENTLLSVRPPEKSSPNSVNMKVVIGEIFMNVRKLAKNRNVQVETPTAVAGVRGTEFHIVVEKTERSIFSVYKGIMDVSAQGKTVTLHTGFATIVEKGKPPMDPFNLPEAPEVETIEMK